MNRSGNESAECAEGSGGGSVEAGQTTGDASPDGAAGGGVERVGRKCGGSDDTSLEGLEGGADGSSPEGSADEADGRSNPVNPARTVDGSAYHR